MLSSALALAATLFLTSPASAQDGLNYTVWSSVILTRTGDRTPEVLGDGTLPTKLTSVGANQAFFAGQFFRNRYIDWENGTNGLADAGAPLSRLDHNTWYDKDVYAMAIDSQWNYATGQAFIQGFYPPIKATNETADLSSRLSDGTYVTGPLGGYQYPRIRTPVLGIDPQFILLDAGASCQTFYDDTYDARYTEEANATRAETRDIYDNVGTNFLGDVTTSNDEYSYSNAYAIYDYLRYTYERENQTQRQLDETVKGTSTTYINKLKQLADQQLYTFYGNTSSKISTIPGNFFAGKVLERLSAAVYGIEYGIDEFQKLNLFFGDIAPFMALFALTALPEQSPEFYGMPNFGSSAVFELWSWANNSIGAVPNPDELYVRFMFSNGTAANDTLRAYSLFNRPKNEFDMGWADFAMLMSEISMAGTTQWCTLCGADESTVSFCPAPETGKHSGLKPVVAGVIGAMVTLAFVLLLFGAAALLGGARIHRNKTSRRKSDLGGFKGGQKMASDQDLSIPKGGATVGATVERHGHERTGSWELKQADVDRNAGDWQSARPSMEQIRPVQPHERV